MVTDNPEIPVGNPLAEATIAKLRRKVFRPRKIRKVGALRGKSYRLNLGTDKEGKAVERRVGSEKKYAEAFRKAWNAAMERENTGCDMTFLDQDIDTSTPTGKLLFGILGSLAVLL